MSQTMCPRTVVACLALIISCSQPAFADDPCNDAKQSTDQVVRALSTSAGPGRLGQGAFRVRRTSGGDSNPAQYDIAYVVSGKTVATASVAKGTQYWIQGWFLDIKSSGADLEVKWNSGGSSCCDCNYTIKATELGFIAIDFGGRKGPTWQFSESVALKLGVREKLGDLEHYTATFVVFGPDGNKLTAEKPSTLSAFVYALFPDDFHGWNGKDGLYSWRAMVGKETVAQGSFIYQYNPSPTIKIVRSAR